MVRAQLKVNCAFIKSVYFEVPSVIPQELQCIIIIAGHTASLLITITKFSMFALCPLRVPRKFLVKMFQNNILTVGNDGWWGNNQ